MVLYGIGFLIIVVWLFFFVKGLKYSNMFEPLEEDDFRLKDIYFVGYAVMETIKYQYKSKSDRTLRKEVSVFYGDKYAEYYLRVIYAQKVTMAFTLLAFAVPVYGLTDSLSSFLVIVMFAGLAFYYYGTLTTKNIQLRSEEMLSDFSNVVSKLALLTNAGMIMREAWEEVAYTGETTIYKEMQTAVNEMNNGVSEIDALYNFGSRCIIPEIKKFTSTIIQGIIKGNSELTMMLQEQSKEVWAIKRQAVRRQGEKASSMLLLPMVIMFAGILIMVVVPIFANIGA
ncbi:MAG: type II secretion system F family protein [Lachnospiraceae bacterium]|nr:type II secretion system F family protein [Lachnospiraceae bacterium]